ncbi:hypothetical protein Peur_039208 [Populus x canadensis]
MELFLFDFDSRFMYGIRKATWLEGYNIEVKTFNSTFHSKIIKTLRKTRAHCNGGLSLSNSISAESFA